MRSDEEEGDRGGGGGGGGRVGLRCKCQGTNWGAQLDNCWYEGRIVWCLSPSPHPRPLYSAGGLP